MARLGADVHCFDELLDSAQPKDTEVIIVEEVDSTGADNAQQEGRKRSRPDASQRSITLAAHWVVLFSLSPYFQTKLERWSRHEPVSKTRRLQQDDASEPEQLQNQQGESYQYSLQLLVPSGQLELGRRLVTAMYSSSPDLSDLAAPQLMQLVALAECYGVGRIVTAAATRLKQLTVETMPLDTATAVFELPEACQALDAFKPVCQTAADKLQQELGDLEVLWADKDTVKRLLALPLGALLQLLGDERTRVASEDTVVQTALQWLEQHRGDSSKAPQLLAVLRLPLCTATFLTSSSIRWFLRVGGVSADEACDLMAMPALSDAQRADWLQVAYAHRPAWHLPRRPASSVMQLQYSWRLPLAEVKKAFESAGQGTIPAPARIGWHGRVWQCGLFVSASGVVGIYMKCHQKACCSCVLAMHFAPPSNQQVQWRLTDKFVNRMLPLQLLPRSAEGATWAQIRAQLEERQVVHPGDMLHCSMTIGKVA